MRPSAVAVVAVAILLARAGQARAQDAATFFEENCSPCHKIGGPPQAIPDLKDVTARRDRDWLIRFLLDPDAFASDPAVVRMVKASEGITMPKPDGLTREMAEALLVLIEQRSGQAAATPTEEPLKPVTPADIARGRSLFLGRDRLSAAGPPCVSCHDTAALPAPGGGRLGPDLTDVNARLGGRRGLTAWLGAAPTPLMRAMYRPAPLTADESHALAAFLEESGPPRAARRTLPFTVLVGGLSGAAATLLVVAAAGRKRFRAVRRPLVSRALHPRTMLGRNALGAAPARKTRERSEGEPGGPQ
jgi:cytochrome c2